MEPAYPDCMIDIETTGTSPDEAAIIQIAGIRFNFAERTLDTDNMFNRCLSIPPKRFWQEDTREFWSRQKPTIIREIYARMEDPKVVMESFAEWGNGLRFWAKPSHFDYAFIESYFKQFEIVSPFDFRTVVDMNSFLRGYHKTTSPVKVDVPFQGDAHNALFDVLHQLNVLFEATK